MQGLEQQQQQPPPPKRRSPSPNVLTYDGCLQKVGLRQTDAVLMCCEFNYSGTLLALGQANGAIEVVQPPAGNTLYKLTSLRLGANLPVTSVRFLENHTNNSAKSNILLATYAAGYSCLWHVTTGELLSSQKEEGHTLISTVSPECGTFCTAGSEPYLNLYDAETHKELRRFEASMSAAVMDGHTNRVFSIRYHPQYPHLIISAGWDDTIQFWDVREQHATRKISGPHISGDSMDIHPVTCNIATGSWRPRNTLEIWDFNTGKLIKSLMPQLNTKAYALRWIGGEHHLLVGGSHENKTMVVDAKNDMDIGSMSGLDSGVYGVDYSLATKTAAIVEGSKLHLASCKLPRSISSSIDTTHMS